MASKRRLRRKSCGRKDPLTAEAAHGQATSLSAKAGRLIHAYPCEWGNHWHVGRPAYRTRQKARAKGA